MTIQVNYNESDEVLVKVGQRVDFDTPFIKKKNKAEIKILIAQRLKLSPTKIFQTLKKFVGDTVEKGDLLAEKKSLFSHQRLISDHRGTVKEIDHREGYLLLTSDQDKKQVKNAYFKGEVVEIGKNKIKIKIDQIKEFPLKEASAEFGGKVFYFKSNNKIREVEEGEIEKKIILAEKLSSYQQLKLEALGGVGFVCLHQLPETSMSHFARLETIDDWKKILDLNFPYCLVDKKNSKIYFYA